MRGKSMAWPAGQGCSRRATRPVASAIPLGNAEFRLAAHGIRFRVSGRALRALSDLRRGTKSGGEGRDESERRGAESQWIVAARPLCHLQYPVAYLSRLQRILPAARDRNCTSRRPARLVRRAGFTNDTCLWGPDGPYCGSASGRRAHASLLARILT